jgi:hypothetical protein
VSDAPTTISAGALRPNWPLYSASSRHRRQHPEDAGAREIAATLAGLADDQAPAIAKGLLTRAQADHQRLVLQAIQTNLTQRLAPTDRVSWRVKVALLRDLIDDRRTGWAADIAKGLRDRADAIRRLAAIEGVHDDYWTGLAHWDEEPRFAETDIPQFCAGADHQHIAATWLPAGHWPCGAYDEQLRRRAVLAAWMAFTNPPEELAA